ncbi:diaminopimelate decarboxylase [Herbaspirillum rubrisubalbicans]|uniref:Diaminopimelate decarboxylase n=1 Tax=Herbaspirillum rubrisubalbicans TaxID=80842 RepID=A0ABX9C032_9BURK|nr:type III PLP-dependent enzyme [Herbaspirillum rubrisubalbicans]RAM63698.1 diaminopimelate decarboxylase [Herbaspirillum rubrisubalbicans]RAN44841.1 diaminopimelate decarboxylase [Herbaspirillum rubrisubalbicans]
MRAHLITDYLRQQSAPACAYLYDLVHLRQRSQRLRAALPPQCRLFYAIKANSDAPILQTLQHTLDGFEVASQGEIEKVRALSEDTPIIFGGPGKTDAELEAALRLGVMLIHVESEHQLRRLDWIAGKLQQRARILLRLNPDPLPGQTQATLRMGGQATQFGIDQARMPAMIALARSLPHIQLEGLHIHALSNNLKVDDHLQLVRHYVELAQAWEAQFDIRFTWLNAGGGIGVNYGPEHDQAQAQFAWEPFCTGLQQLLAQTRPGFELIFECGRYITADCGCYVSEVIDIKTTHGKHFAILRGGSHHFRLPSSWQHDHPFQVHARDDWPYPFARPGLRDAKVSICGELCTPKDVLARDVPLAEIRAGDCLVFALAGAYGWHISHHDFLSHPHPERRYFSD